MSEDAKKDKREPDLELPSFGFGRKKKKGAPEQGADAADTVEAPVEEQPEAYADEPADEGTQALPASELPPTQEPAASRTGLRPVAGSPRRRPPVPPPPPAHEPAPSDERGSVAEPLVEPLVEAAPQAATATEPIAPAEPVTSPEPVAPPEPEDAPEPVAPPEPEDAPEPVAPPEPEVAPEPVVAETEIAAETEPGVEPELAAYEDLFADEEPAAVKPRRSFLRRRTPDPEPSVREPAADEPTDPTTELTTELTTEAAPTHGPPPSAPPVPTGERSPFARPEPGRSSGGVAAPAFPPPTHEPPVTDVEIDDPGPAEPDVAASEEARPRRGLPSLQLPTVSPTVGAAVVGVLVGLVGVALAYVAGQGCELVRGVSSCGGLGVIALLVMVAVEIVLGVVLLRALGFSDPGTTSFLGVGMLAVLAMIFFFDALGSGWMFVVLPLLTGITFVAARWITTASVDGLTT